MTTAYTLTAAHYDDCALYNGTHEYLVELESADGEQHHEIRLDVEFHSEGEQLHILGGADEPRTWMRGRGHDAVVSACELARLSPRGRFVAKTKAVAEAVEPAPFDLMSEFAIAARERAAS